MTRRLFDWRLDLAALIVFASLTVLMTWPMLLRLDTHFAGQDPDVWINPWATWWTEQAVFEGSSLYYTHSLFYPEGVSLAFHSFSHVNAALALLLSPWLGDLAAYNITILLAHATSGYAMFCLVRYVTRSSAAALFGGLAFAFFPYRLAESVHPVIVSTQWLPLYFLSVLCLINEGHRRHIVLAALFFTLNALSSWHLMLFATLLSVIYLAYVWLFERWRCSRATVYHLVRLVGLIGVVLAPFLYPLVREQMTTSGTYVGVELEVGRGNDVIAFFLPAKEHPVWGEFVTPIHERIHNKQTTFLGLTLVGLSGVGSLADWKRARFWLLLALFSLVLSLGSHLQINGHAFDTLLPWSVPVVWLVRHPFRFGVLLGFALAVLGGVGLSALLDRLPGERFGTAGVLGNGRWLLAGVAATLLLFEYLFLPFPGTRAQVSDFYASIPSARGAILNLPMGRQPSKRYLYHQTLHSRPIVGGIVSRTPLDAYAFVESMPALRSLRACERALPPANIAPLLSGLRQQGIDYVILHKDLVKPFSSDLWLSTRTVPPEYEDEQIDVYSTRKEHPFAAGTAHLLEGCIAVRTLITDTVDALQGETIEVPLEWVAGNWIKENFELELALIDENGEEIQRQRYDVTPGAPLLTWRRGEPYRATHLFQLAPLLPPGPYRLQAVLVPSDRREDSLLSAHLLDLQIQTRPRNFDLPAMQETSGATFGDDLRLLGYDLEVGDDAVHVTLHWRCLRRMEANYKFFVHLYDAESEVVAQADVVPHDWTYPTTWWEAGEVVSDDISVSLTGAKPGTYRLAIGVYDSVSLERLAIRAAGSQRLEGGQVMLIKEIRIPKVSDD